MANVIKVSLDGKDNVVKIYSKEGEYIMTLQIRTRGDDDYIPECPDGLYDTNTGFPVCCLNMFACRDHNVFDISMQED